MSLVQVRVAPVFWATVTSEASSVTEPISVLSEAQEIPVMMQPWVLVTKPATPFIAAPPLEVAT
ncbi:hypothetical protein D3C78_1464750 [compost metagenome]